MIIVAKFAGRCAVCNGSILAGSKIEWTKGSPSRHVACPAVTKSAPAPAAMRASIPAADASIKIYERWEPCRRAGLRSVVGESRRNGELVVVSQREVFQSTDDADDFGDCNGASWQVTLTCRVATPEERAVYADRVQRAAVAKLAIAFGALGPAIERAAAEAAFAAAKTEGSGEIWSVGALPSEVIWRDGRGSWIARVALPTGEMILASYTYIYDWDQPVVLAGSQSAIDALVLAESVTRLGDRIASFAARRAA